MLKMMIAKHEGCQRGDFFKPKGFGPKPERGGRFETIVVLSPFSGLGLIKTSGGIMTTLLTQEKMENLLRMLSWTLGCKGDVMEVGVYKGGALIGMAELVSGWHQAPQVYGFDTFEGILKPDLRDENTPHAKGDFTCSFEQVKENVKLYKNICLVKGIFPHDTPPLPWIRFAHIDVDLFMPTLEAMTYVWPMIVEGGIMVIDDYDWPDTPGVKKAVDHFMDFHKLEEVPCPEWQMAFIKKETTWTTK